MVVATQAREAVPPSPLALQPVILLASQPQLPASRLAHLQTVQTDLQQGPSNRYWVDGKAQQGFDIDSIRQAECLTMQLTQPQAEDALLASGAALALGKPMLYLTSDRKQLPWFLQEADLAFPHLVQVVTTTLADEMVQAWQKLPGGSLPSSHLVQQPVDSFIGCLMSKLTKEQYAEGKTHLEAIRDSMTRFGGRSSPYCEGILVKSSDAFDTPSHALQVDLEALRQSENCVFYLYDGKSRPSGMWVEMGAALAWDKPCVLLTPDRKALPPSLQGYHLPKNLRVVTYSDHAQLLKQLKDPQQAPEYILP